ncbi:MAG: FkbM family methyltransferase [Acidobacteriaceae bacterium]
MPIPEFMARPYRKYGLRGILSLLFLRSIGAAQEVKVYPPSLRHGLRLRMKTSDELAFVEVVLEHAYHFDLPFTPRVIIDAGANIGVASIYFANRYPEAKIFAVEPEPANYALLVKNLRRYPSIVPVHAALWSHDGEISVSLPDPSTGAVGNWAFFTHEGEGVRVRALRMESLLKELGLDTVDFMKVDIEGSEIEIFESAGWVNHVRALAIETHDELRPGCTAAVVSAMRNFQRRDSNGILLFTRQD